MKTLGVMIRRKNRTSRKLLNKEILTLHRRLKKKDELITHYSTEKDFNRNTYHSHLLFEFEDDTNLISHLNRFIGGDMWEKKIKGIDTIHINNGKWGEIHTHIIYDKEGFQQYMNKFSPITTLI